MATGNICLSVRIIVVVLALLLREMEGCYCPWGSWSSTSGCPVSVHQCACRNRLGMESGTIPNSRITASSFWRDFSGDLMHAPYRGRLNGVAGVGAWVALRNNIGEWLQVDLGEMKRVSGVIIQGRHHRLARWVTSYQLRYKADGSSWMTYADIHGQQTIFSGITNTRTPVTNLLDNAIYARYVRFVVYSWTHWIAMRVEILGCNYDGSQTRTRNPCCQPSIETRRADCWECSWSSWSSWSTCSGGSQSRRRYRGTCCSRPHEDTRTQSCNTNTCEWGTWQSWTSCVPPCGAGTQTRTRYRDHSCNPSSQVNSRSCHNTCNTCEWGTWQSWTSCWPPCGAGTQIRIRLRDHSCNPSRQEDSRSCHNTCNTNTCEWGTWQSWTSCWPPCGAGKQTRTRYRESSCNPNHEEDTRSCNNSCDDGTSNTNVNGSSGFQMIPEGLVVFIVLAGGLVAIIVVVIWKKCG